MIFMTILKPPQSCDLVWPGLSVDVWFVRFNSPWYSFPFKLNSVDNSSEHTSGIKEKVLRFGLSASKMQIPLANSTSALRNR